MRRRHVLAAIGGSAFGWPLATRGEDGVRRIGILTALAENDPGWRRNFAGFAAGLKSAGWIEGQNYRLETRHVPGGNTPEDFRDAAKELVAAAPDVILAVPALTAAVALLRETHVIPIVFLLSFDPIQEGLVTNIAHPTANVTGFIGLAPSVAGRLPQVLKELAPNVTRAICLVSRGWTLSRISAEQTDSIDQGALASGLTASTAVVGTDEEIERALAAFSQQPNGGLIVPGDSFVTAHRAQVLAMAARFRLPAVYFTRFFVVEGGLVSYGIDQPDLFRQSGSYVDRILRGAKPTDLPVQSARKFELVINLKTAKALGLTVPSSLLAQADEVIE